MITFDLLKAKHKVYYFYDLNKNLQEYKKGWDDYLSNPSLKLNIPKNIYEIGIFDAQENKNKNKNCSTFNIKKFMIAIFVTEKQELNELVNGKTEKITIEQLNDYIKLALLQENYFSNSKYKISKENFLKIIGCLSNFHTHSSKYVNSSSALSILSPIIKETLPFINSGTVKEGLDFSMNLTSGLGRENPSLVKAISMNFSVNNEHQSLYKILFSTLETQNTIYSEIIINLLDFDLTSMLPIKVNQNEDITTFNAQSLWYSSEKFTNLIPIPSIKILSFMSALDEKSKNIIKKNDILDFKEKNKDKIHEKNYLKAIDELEQKNIWWISKKIKSVASNPQNISDFASMKNGSFERIIAYKTISKKLEQQEKNFFYIQAVFLKNNLKDKDLNSKYPKLKNILIGLPNKVQKNLLNSYLGEIATKIYHSLKILKASYLKLSKIQQDRLKIEISDKNNSYIMQKYIYDYENLTPKEKQKLSHDILYKYENINSLSDKEQTFIQEKLFTLIEKA